MSKEKATQQINSSRKSASKKNSNRKRIVTLAVAVVVVLGGVFLYQAAIKGDEAPKSFNNVVTPENIDEIMKNLEQSHTPVGSYEVNMTNDWVFRDGDSASENAYVENSTANTNTVYFTLTREDDGSTIYKSPYIDVGSYLRDIKLDKDLDAGVYECVMTYHLVDKRHKELSAVSLNLTITVNN